MAEKPKGPRLRGLVTLLIEPEVLVVEPGSQVFEPCTKASVCGCSGVKCVQGRDYFLIF